MAVNDTAGIRHFKNHGVAVLVEHLLDGELVEVLGLVVGDLLTVDTESLCEVSVAIEEAYCGHVDAAVGCFLDIVAREHAETTGINLEAVAETILH